MNPTPDILDWTEGSAGLVYQRCVACRAVWYMHREFCPACGHSDPEKAQASGRGIVYALTTVTRAPSEALRSFAPYTLVLVDCEEGFRVMAHGLQGLTIGTPVRAEFFDFGGRLIPRFQADTAD